MLPSARHTLTDLHVAGTDTFPVRFQPAIHTADLLPSLSEAATMATSSPPSHVNRFTRSGHVSSPPHAADLLPSLSEAATMATSSPPSHSHSIDLDLGLSGRDHDLGHSAGEITISD